MRIFLRTKLGEGNKIYNILILIYQRVRADAKEVSCLQFNSIILREVGKCVHICSFGKYFPDNKTSIWLRTPNGFWLEVRDSCGQMP